MSDTQTPQSDKNRRSRNGSFLLFLTVLVVALVLFGNEQFQRREVLTQDQFEFQLYTGQVDRLEFRGNNEVLGQLKNDSRFQVSFASLDQREAEYRQLNAIPAYRPVTPGALREAIEGGWYRPFAARHLSAVRESIGDPIPRDEEQAQATVTRPEQRDYLYVGVVARSLEAYRKDVSGGRSLDAPFALPEQSGQLWLEVRDIEDLEGLLATLETDVPVQNISFDLRPLYGTTHGAAAASFAQMLLIYGPWILFIAIIFLFMRQMRSQGTGAGVMSFGRSRAQLYSKENHTNVTFDDVAGAQEAKEEVREVVEFLKNPGRFTRIGGRIPRGVLLNGPPGCGKTLLAKAIAGEAEVPFFSISGSDFVEMFVGVGASRVRDLFKQARENSPCIIFLDEIDAVGRRRGSGMGGGHDEREQTLNAILVEMDGFGTDEGIIVVAATNRPDVLDPALLRPGRFDREVTIDFPDLQGRREIIKVHLKKVKTGDDVDVETLARSTPGYSGADLAAIVNEAAIMAVLDKRDVIGMKHLEEAAAKVRYGRQKKSRNIEEDDRKITAYHEAGHTLVGARIEEVDMPHKVTIVPRGRALGATMFLPTKESYHMQKKRLVGQLAMAFGGRVAEELFCGDISAGASDDIKRATEMARTMVTELGMSDRVGPINYAERQGSDFLGTELMSGKWHSEETARIIDEEIQILIKEAYETARRIIDEDRESMERLTEALMQYETINEDEIVKLINGTEVADLHPPKPEEPEAAPAPRAQPADPGSSTAKGTEDLSGGDLSGEAGLSPA